MSRKDFYIARIDKIAKESFNAGQKAIAKKIIEVTDEKDLDEVWGFVSQRVKIGFTFDEAPEINHQTVSVVKENEKLFIGSPNEEKNEHKLIIGENYDALKNLLVTYVDSQGKGLIDVIYIDPPYNTEKSKEEGNDYKDDVDAKRFIYRDKFTRDGWLNMMNERLKLAKKLLSDKGVIFISIDDSEQAYLKILCDEVFGEDNFVGTYLWKKTETPPSLSYKIRKKLEYILCYQTQNVPKRKFVQGLVDGSDAPLLNTDNPIGKLVFPVGSIKFNIPNGTYTANKNYRIKLLKPIIVKNGVNTTPVEAQGNFKWKQSYLENEIKSGTYFLIKSNEFSIRYQKPEKATKVPANIIDKEVGVGTNETADKELTELGLNGMFDYRKPVSLIKYLIKMAFWENNSVTVLDFFAGSGTTGQAVMELNEDDEGNRKFILVTNDENDIATKVTRERLYRVITGKGSKNEKITWEYSKEKKSLINNTVRVFNIKTEKLTITEIDKAEKIKAEAEKDFKNLSEKYKIKNDLHIYTQLASLNPQRKEK